MPYIDNGNMDDYLKRMKKSKEWMGEIEMRAVSQLYGMRVAVYEGTLDASEIYNPRNESMATLRYLFII